MVSTLKFSGMTAGGDLANGESTPGLLGGGNVLFNNPWTFLTSGTTGDRPTPDPSMYYRLRLNTTLQVYEYYNPITVLWTELSGSGTGTVNPGTTNEIPFYAANGQTLSPLAAVANAVLITSAGMVPSLSTTLPSGLSIPGAIITSSTAALTAGSVVAAPAAGTDIANKTYVDTKFASGVTSITGTTNQVIASAATGAVTLSLPQDIAIGSTPTFGGLTLSSIPLNGASGGTGVANTGKTITLGGNITTAGALTTSGAFASTFTMTNTTNVTFPTSGTLATTTGTVASVSGTANRITSTGGNNPVIDISAAYVGQSSITTLGTIGTGTWQGDVIGGTYGGTGVNNGASTITVGGNTAFSGAFTFTGTVTGNTSVTFPTSGTLLTAAGAVTSLTGTANQITVSAAVGAVTVALASNPILPGTGGVTLPSGNTAARAGGAGTMRFNSQTNVFEGTVDGAAWAAFETSSTGVVSVSGTANRITSTGGTTPVIDISASYVGQSSITTLGTITTGRWNGTNIALANGGTSASLTASNGGIFYSTGSAGAILSGTATANQLLLSGANTTPAWSTSTYPATNAINTLLYASSANVMSALATANNGILVTSAGGVPSIGNTVGAGLTMPSITFNSTSGIIGTTTNNNAAAGSVGEMISSVIAFASAVPVTTATATNITNIALTAGDWDIWGNVLVNDTLSTTLAAVIAWVSGTSATLPDASLYAEITGIAGNAIGLTCPSYRVSLAGNATYYLSTFAVAGTGTLTACGGIYARRVR